MQEKRSVRFGKWLLKAIVSYAVFIAAGLLLAFVPAGRLGLSEEMFLNLRMFFMLFGPVYLTLFAKIILTFIATVKRREPDVSERNRGILFAVTALLLFANLSNAQTVADLSSGLIESEGLKSLNRSKRYNLKGKRFLNVFLPIAFYMLILEILSLLVCIVTFAPLSNAASNAFIFTISLTALLLLLIPLILTFISGFKGDKEDMKESGTRNGRPQLWQATWSWKPIPFAANSICGCRSCLCWWFARARSCFLFSCCISPRTIRTSWRS